MERKLLMNNFQAGKMIRRLRRQNNLTMVDFAKELGLSQPSLSRIESGNQEITLSLLEDMCYVFGISMSEFISILEGNSELQRIEFSRDDKVEREEELDAILSNAIASFTFEQKQGLYALLLPYMKD